MRLTAAVFFLAWLAAALNTPFTDLGVTQTYDTVSKITTGVRYIEAKCTPADWAKASNGQVPTSTYTISNANGTGTYTLTMKCNPPVWYYTLTPIYYIPTDGRVYISDYCRMPDPTQTNQSMTDVMNRARMSSIMKTTLLAEHEWRVNLHRERLMKRGPGDSSADAVRRHTAELQDILGTILCTTPWVGLVTSLAGGCGPQAYPDPATISKLQGQVSSLQAAQDDLYNKQAAQNRLISSLNQQTQDMFGQQIYVNQQMQATMATQAAQINVAYNQANLAMDTVNKIGSFVERSLNGIRDQQAQLAQANADTNGLVAQLAQQNNAALNAVVGKLNDNANATNFMVNDLATRLAAEVAQSFLRDFTQDMLIRSLQGQIVRVSDRVQERRAHTRVLLTKVTQALHEGYTPFVTDIGTAPLAGVGFSLEVDNIRIRYFYNGGSYLREDHVSVFCTADFIIEHLGSAQSPNDIMNAMGPNGCTPGQDCNCWFSWKHQDGCNANLALVWPGTSGTSDPQYFRQPTSLWRTAKMINSTFCQNGFLTMTTPTVFTNASLVLNMFTTIASTAYNYDVNTFVLASLYSASAGVASYDASVLTMTFADMVHPTSASNLVATFFRLLNIQQSSYATMPEALMRIIDGVRPTASFYDLPFVPVNGTVAMCSQTAFMAYNMSSYVPVYSVAPTQAVASLTVTLVNDNNHSDVKTIPAQSYNLANSLSSTMPGFTYMVGNPLGDRNGYVYDINTNDIGTSIAATGHSGKVSYALCAMKNDAFGNPTVPPNPSVDCTPAAWAARSQGQHFDAFEGTNVASFYKVQIDPVTGGCSTLAGSWNGDLGGMCRMRQLYAFGGDGTTSLTLTPTRTGTYTATFPVPVGQIIVTTASQCPVAFVTDKSVRGLTLNLQNVNTYDITATAYFASPTGCGCSAPGITVVTVPAASTLPVRVAPCAPGPSGCTAMTVTLLQGNVNDGSAVPCPTSTPINVTTPTSEEAMGALGQVDATFVQQSAMIQNDYVHTAAVALLAQTQDTLMQLAYITERIAIRSGLTALDPYPYSAIFANIAASAQALQNASLNQKGQITAQDYSDIHRILSDADAQSAANQAKFDQLAAQSADERAKLGQLISVQSDQLAEMNKTRQALDTAMAATLNASRVVANIQVDIGNTMVNAMQQIYAGSSAGPSLGSFGNLINDGLNAVAQVGKLPSALEHVAEEAASKASDLVGAAVGLAKDALAEIKGIIDSVASGAASFMKMALYGIIGIVGLLVMINVGPKVMKAMNKGKKGTRTRKGEVEMDD